MDYAHKIEKQRKSFYGAARRTARKMLHSYSAELMKDIRKVSTTNDIIRLGERELKSANVEAGIKKIYYDTLPFFANQTVKQLVTKKSETVTPDYWLTYINSFVRSRLGEKIKRINETTQKLFREVTKEVCSLGINEGWGYEKITDKIQSELNIAERYRAERIARTEVVGASNEGSYAGAKETGLDLMKEWIAYIDDRTRESHAQPIEPVEMNEKFDVGGAELEYPGDPNGPPEEVINCRCTIGYITKDDLAVFGREFPE